MNMFKKNGGFTLVELIVVIAILAILAGVAVPAYTGYISKAQEANDLTLLDSVKTAVVFEVMEENAEATVKKIEVSSPQTSGTVTADVTYGDDSTGTVTITEYVEKIEFKSDNTTATWVSEGDNANKWVLE